MSTGTLKVVRDWPPNIDAIRAVFSVSSNTIFTYAPYVYLPGGGTLSPHLEAHEAVHITQQGSDPEAWWKRYLEDEEFRYAQELEAHRAEWRVARKTKDPNARSRLRMQIARRLASPLYGSLVTVRQALKAIR